MDPVEAADQGLVVAGELALRAAEDALIADFPFLGLPVIKEIWEFFLAKYEQKVIAAFQAGTTGMIITFTDDSKNEVAQQAKDKLAQELAQPDADKEKAIDDFKKAYGDLIHMRNSTP